MALDNLSLQLLLVFSPGILATIIFDKFTFHRQKSLRDFFISSFVLGVISILLFSIPQFFCKNP